MAIFRCNRSGNTILVYDENDLVAIRKHEGYTEIKDETSTDAPVEVPQAPEAQVLKSHVSPVIVTKKRGRPAKVK